jgi:hypothetical protein
MRIENLIMGGCSLDDEEVEQIYDLNGKLQDVMQDIVLKLIELRKDAPMSKEAAMATVLHDFEFIIEDEMCEAEDLIRGEVPEEKLTDFAILCETLKASHTGYWESVKKHLNK